MSGDRRKPSDRFARNESGASAIEFALLSPLLILLVVGIIQIGWVLHCAASVRWALDASARSLLINPDLTADQLRSAMLTKLSGLAEAPDLSVTLTRDASAGALRVQTRFDAQLALPLLSTNTMTFRNAVTVPILE